MGRNRFRPRRQAFTLVEVMVIVLVVGITSALSIPTIHGVMAERLARDASSELVLLARRARAEAAAYGRAHVLRWNSGANGTFNVYRGRASSCNAQTNDWAALIAASNCTRGAAPGFCVDRVEAGDYYLGSLAVRGSTDVLITEGGGIANLDLCFEPNGRVLWRTVLAGRFSDQNTVGGGFQFVFQRREDGAPMGVARRVAVPLGGNARELR